VAQKLLAAQELSGQVGNMYTGSIFLALIGLLTDELRSTTDVAGKKYGFVAYGSGSKSKVFEGVVQAGWQKPVEQIDVATQLSKRAAVDFDMYVVLHTRQTETPLTETQHRHFRLAAIGTAGLLPGQRQYVYIPS
jgi:hydroxymethylglutaryl-CoA synthase